jgi:hypothetical protein
MVASHEYRARQKAADGDLAPRYPCLPSCILATTRPPSDPRCRDMTGPLSAMVPSVRRVIVHPHRHLPLANAYICATDATGGGRACQPSYLAAFDPARN